MLHDQKCSKKVAPVQFGRRIHGSKNMLARLLKKVRTREVERQKNQRRIVLVLMERVKVHRQPRKKQILVFISRSELDLKILENS